MIVQACVSFEFMWVRQYYCKANLIPNNEKIAKIFVNACVSKDKFTNII